MNDDFADRQSAFTRRFRGFFRCRLFFDGHRFFFLSFGHSDKLIVNVKKKNPLKENNFCEKEKCNVILFHRSASLLASAENVACRQEV